MGHCTSGRSRLSASHHAERESKTAGLLLRGGPSGVHRFDVWVVLKARSGYLGVLPHAESRPSHRCSSVDRGIDTRYRGGSSPVHPPGQLPRRLAGPSLAGALRIVCPGRGASYCCGALRRAEPRSGSAGETARRIPLEQCRGSYRGSKHDLAKVAPLLGMERDWSAFLAEETATEHVELLRSHERTRRPLGGDELIGQLEKTIGRRPSRKRPGPKRPIEGN